MNKVPMATLSTKVSKKEGHSRRLLREEDFSKWRQWAANAVPHRTDLLADVRNMREEHHMQVETSQHVEWWEHLKCRRGSHSTKRQIYPEERLDVQVAMHMQFIRSESSKT